MKFAYPYVLLLLLFVAYFIYRAFFNKKKDSSSYIKYSNIKNIKLATKTNKIITRNNLINIIKIFALIFFILALARLQIANKTEEVLTKGYEIMLCLDTSTSMLAEDFRPKNRLAVAKKVVKDFISKRSYDRIGLVVFSKIAFTQCPLTTDHSALLNFLDKTEIGITQTDGTSLGNAIAACASRFKNTKSKSKIAILLTDGRNNSGEIDPLTAAEAAKALGVKIYTIGIGSKGIIP